MQSQRRGRSVEPVIAFGRQRQLHLIQLTANDDDMDHTGRHRIRSRPLLRFQLDFDLRALQWIDARMVVLHHSTLRHLVAISLNFKFYNRSWL